MAHNPLNFLHVVSYCVSSTMITNCLLVIKKGGSTSFALENNIPSRILQGAVFSYASHRWVFEKLTAAGEMRKGFTLFLE